MQMVKEEFGGDFKEALGDGLFVSRMQERVRPIWQIYRQGYRKLEDLEKREGYPAMSAYAEALDDIAGHLPAENRAFCHYAFSGVDFYWARIFDKVVFEDIAFDKEELPTMWWEPETYSSERRAEIISTLKAQRVMPESAVMQFLAGDAEIPGDDNQFNNPGATLLVKGGHDFIGYVESRFGESNLQYGAVIIVSPSNPIEKTEERLAQDGYHKKASLDGIDCLAPYAMELKDIHIFLK
jgi:hypothetical protein